MIRLRCSFTPGNSRILAGRLNVPSQAQVRRPRLSYDMTPPSTDGEREQAKPQTAGAQAQYLLEFTTRSGFKEHPSSVICLTRG